MAVKSSKKHRWTLCGASLAALSMAVGQSIALLMGGGSLSLWPLAIVAMTIVSLPQLAAAVVGSKVSPRKETSPP